jgi:hypothetical protein
MDIFLSKVTQQAMNYAIRSGVTITATYALRQSARLLKNIKSSQREELVKLQERLQQKIKIISPAIDMIELISARGNTSLESAVSLTKEIRWEIQSLGQRLAKAASDEEASRRCSSKAKTQAQTDIELKLIAQDIQKLLDRIEDAVPLISLAITTSGASLSTSLPATVSPSRLLQASTFLTAADTQYCMAPAQSVPVGPTFTLSIYMLFEGHVREEGIRETTWKEVIHKARVNLRRNPMDLAGGRSQHQSNNVPNGTTPSLSEQGHGDYFDAHMAGDARVDEYSYQLVIVEDLDDDRMHDFEDEEVKPGRFEDVELAGIREFVPVHEISKIFYADTGKILNIGTEGETNSPVLLLKRDINAIPPRRMMERTSIDHPDYEDDHGIPQDSSESQSKTDAAPQDEQSQSQHETWDPWRFPPGLDPEWIAFEVYTEAEDSDTESEPGASQTNSRKPSLSPSVAQAFAGLHLNSSPKTNPQSPTPSSPSPRNELLPQPSPGQVYHFQNPSFNNIRTSLSLLEVLLRLTSLQQFQQQSHLSINDELLNFFLEESSATGAGGDEDHRQRIRAEARRRVGWDPYDESPVKRRGEEYQYQAEAGDGRWENESAGWDGDPNGYSYEQSPRSSPIGPASHGYHLRSREESPATPPMRPKNDSSRGTTPGSNGQLRPPFAKSPSTPSGPPKGRQAFLRRQTDETGTGRRGSPLARPSTGLTDEGIGSSPSSHGGRGRGDDERNAKHEPTTGD